MKQKGNNKRLVSESQSDDTSEFISRSLVHTVTSSQIIIIVHWLESTFWCSYTQHLIYHWIIVDCTFSHVKILIAAGKFVEKIRFIYSFIPKTGRFLSDRKKKTIIYFCFTFAVSEWICERKKIMWVWVILSGEKKLSLTPVSATSTISWLYCFPKFQRNEFHSSRRRKWLNSW